MTDVTTETPKDKQFDAEAFAMNVARAMESGGRALAAYLKPRESGELKDKSPDEMAEVIKTLTTVAEYWLSDSERAADLQTRMAKGYLDLWGSAMRRLAGEDTPPAISPSPRDKRFADPEWKSNQFFDFVMQLYLLTTQWAQDLVRNAEGVDLHTRKKAEFYVNQITNALAPSNFILTNPEVLRETVAQNGDNLARGMSMLAEDIESGNGMLRIRQSDPANLVVGVNMATTPGKVIYQNDLMQLIQYQATTENVLRTPLLIVPPWINKFYILDLSPEKSFIKWCVDQGITVFVISWVNPDKNLGAKTWEDYMKEGPLAAMDVIEKATGEMKVHTMGYCVGGTLLATTLAWLAEKRRQRVTSATLLAAQVDFTHAGDLLVFVDEGQISTLERDMQESGVLEGAKMAMAFNMLRSNDLIWSRIVHDYLLGEREPMTDLMAWNADATRMPARMHSEYLRRLFLNNDLFAGRYEVGGRPIVLSDIRAPIFVVATVKDHVAPWRSVYKLMLLSDTEVTFLLTSGGHNAGIVSEPGHAHRSYQVSTRQEGETYVDPEAWQAATPTQDGSWWPAWAAWLDARSCGEVPPPQLGAPERGYPVLGDAPGRYVVEA